MTTDRRSRIGFRGRVIGSFVALVAGALFAGLFVQRAVSLERLDRSVDENLDQERSELERLASGTDPSTGQPFGSDVNAIFETFLSRNQPSDGEAFFTFVGGVPGPSTPAPLRLDLDDEIGARWAALTVGEWGQFDTDAGPVRYLAVPLQFEGRTSGVFVVANFVRAERDDIESTVFVSVLVTTAILVIASAVAWLVAGRLLRPVRQLTEAAESISDTDLSRRIPVEGHDEIARLANRFNEMLDRLSSSFALQRAFIDDAGHELRTPITIVRGHLELMGDDPQDRRDTVALVTDELDRMARIVDDLLVLAKSEQPDFVRREPVEVADLTADLLLKASALGHRAWRLGESAEGEVDLDPQRIAQAVLNLARNAVEHSAPGSEIVISSRRTDDELHIAVTDHGVGIDQGELERVFERFARGRSSARRSDGAGLGLAIVRSVAAAHGGRIDVASEVGGGSTFTIVVPARSGVATPASAPATLLWPAPTTNTLTDHTPADRSSS